MHTWKSESTANAQPDNIVYQKLYLVDPANDHFRAIRLWSYDFPDGRRNFDFDYLNSSNPVRHPDLIARGLVQIPDLIFGFARGRVRDSGQCDLFQRDHLVRRGRRCTDATDFGTLEVGLVSTYLDSAGKDFV